MCPTLLKKIPSSLNKSTKTCYHILTFFERLLSEYIKKFDIQNFERQKRQWFGEIKKEKRVYINYNFYMLNSYFSEIILPYIWKHTLYITRMFSFTCIIHIWFNAFNVISKVFPSPHHVAWSQNRFFSYYVYLSLSLSRIRMHRDNNFSRRRHANTNFGDHELRDEIALKKKRKDRLGRALAAKTRALTHVQRSNSGCTLINHFLPFAVSPYCHL